MFIKHVLQKEVVEANYSRKFLKLKILGKLFCKRRYGKNGKYISNIMFKVFLYRWRLRRNKKRPLYGPMLYLSSDRSHK